MKTAVVYQRELRKKRKQNGICVYCGHNPIAAESKSRCRPCLESGKAKIKILRQRKIATGVCYKCPAKATRVPYCEKHWLENSLNKKQVRIWRQENNRCEDCGSKDVIVGSLREKGVFCEECYLRGLAYRHKERDTRKYGYSDLTGEQLKNLFAKRSMCPYSGRQLTLGVNASLDHVVPPCRGGTTDITNFQFVYSFGHIDYNRMKGSMTHEEFIAELQMLSKRM